MNDLVFEEPPPRAAGYTKHAAIAEKLREHPGQWARITRHHSMDSARQAAYRIRTGRLRPYEPAGAFEAEWRLVDGVHYVYARYAGAEGSA